MKPEIVVFDLAGVLCRFHPERRLTELSAMSGLPEAVIDQAIWGSGLDERAERGDFTPDELTDQLFSILDGRITVEELRAAWSTAFELDDAVLEIVSAVRKPRYAFTNNGPMMTSCLDHELRHVLELFARVICSWELKARKPDVEAFLRLAIELDVLAASVVFVDDAAANCRGAEAAGLQAIQFTSAPELEGRLQELGLLPVT